jgi:hypothetical protein
MYRGLIAVAVLAVAVVGCGGSSKSNKQLSYGATGTQLTAICTKAKAQTGSVQLTGDPKGDAKAAQRVKAAVDAGLKEVDKIKPPDQLKSAFDQFKSTSEQQSAALQKAITAGNAGDKAGTDAALQEYQTLNQKNNLVASKLGAKGCIG